MTIKELKEQLNKIDEKKGIIVVSCGMMSAVNKIVVDSDVIFIEGNIGNVDHLELELNELKSKIQKYEEIYSGELKEKKGLDETQLFQLGNQIDSMDDYLNILTKRITYNLNKKEK